MPSTWYEFFKDWQIMASALVTLGAAVLAYKSARKQLDQGAEHHQDLLNRKRRAMRALMPDALADFDTYAERSVEYLEGQRERPPERPSEAAADLKATVEFLDPSAAEQVRQLLSQYQIQRTQLCEKGWFFSERLKNTVVLMGYVHTLYEYAWSESENVQVGSPSRANMERALEVCFGDALTGEYDKAGYEGLICEIDEEYGPLSESYQQASAA